MNVEPVLADDITNANLSMNVQDSTLTTIVTEAGSIFFLILKGQCWKIMLCRLSFSLHSHLKT